MSIEKYTISRDDGYYQAWPDIVLTKNGCIICVFTETTHHVDRVGSRLVICKSRDKGRTWSNKIPLTERNTDKYVYHNCARISKLPDGTLAIICDYATRDDRHEGVEGTVQNIWFSYDDGETWSAPHTVKLQGIVPDRYNILKSGRHFITAHRDNPKTGKLAQYAKISDDGGKTWSDDITVASDERYNLCEASVIELDDGVLVCYMRENSGKGIDCLKTFSYDGGLTWSEIYNTNIPGCHRPTVGRLQSGNYMMTYRFLQGGRGGFGRWTQNLFAAFFDETSVRAEKRSEHSARIMPLDYDRSPVADIGYSGWVQFDDGEIYVAYYIVDDAPKGQIRGCSFYPDDIVIGGIIE